MENDVRSKTYANERLTLSKYASLSQNTRGRARAEQPCGMRTDYQRDRDRIIYSKAFIRLKNKTQVFFSPEGDHFVTRLTHTLDVSQIARSLARALSLNEDLAEAIALGHDLGHTPFGHSGERILNKLSPSGFRHNEQSVRVVDVLEKDGAGLNLTYEVRDGILNHNGDGASTLEGRCVHIADRVAYINHDLNDAIRAGVLRAEDVPGDIVAVLGSTSRERINTAITSVWRNSADKPFVAMEEKVMGYIYGADDYIQKPFNVKLLLARCDNLVKNRRILLGRKETLSSPAPLSEGLSASDRTVVEKAAAIVRRNFDNSDFSMDGLAAELNMSRTKMFSFFKAALGITPNDFTLNLKMEEAARMLVGTPDANISEISYALGFSSPRYFSRCFKAYYNLSPQQYRKNGGRR